MPADLIQAVMLASLTLFIAAVPAHLGAALVRRV